MKIIQSKCLIERPKVPKCSKQSARYKQVKVLGLSNQSARLSIESARPVQHKFPINFVGKLWCRFNRLTSGNPASCWQNDWFDLLGGGDSSHLGHF